MIENVVAKPNGILPNGDARQLALPLGSARGGEHARHAERARALIESLEQLSSEDVFAAFEELDGLPSEVVRTALAASTGPAPDPESLDDETRRAHGWPPRPLRLRTVAITMDADIFDLGSIAEEQLRVAGKAWDGRDLSAEERLDGEIDDSFAGTLAHRVLADAEKPGSAPLFDVLTYAGDAGSIFRAGTTELVGAIAYGVVEMSDRRSRVAIQEALGAPVEDDVVEDAPSVAEDDAIEPAYGVDRVELVELTPPLEASPKPKKKMAAKKSSAPKKTASVAKESAKKDVPAEAAPTSAKKAPVKKVAPKKATAKKVAVKKTTAKKPATKKTTVKKTAAKTKTAKTKPDA
jgi:hypothetical protein